MTLYRAILGKKTFRNLYEPWRSVFGRNTPSYAQLVFWECLAWESSVNNSECMKCHWTSTLNKCCCFSLWKKCVMISTKILCSTTVFNIGKNCFLSTKSTYNRMISEGSCDTEDWSNDSENSALLHRNKLHLYIIYIILLFYCIFNQLNAAFVSKYFS